MKTYYTSSRSILCTLWRSKPFARADIKGISQYPELKGHVEFYLINDGLIILWNISGLPEDKLPCKYPIFTFYIGDDCEASSNLEDSDCLQSQFTGLPPLLSNDGHSFGMVLSNQIIHNKIIKKPFMIFAGAGDFNEPDVDYWNDCIGSGIIEQIH